MTVDTNIDEEVLLFHDFEYEEPCDSSEPCGNVAEWRLVRRCCGGVSLLCNPCKVGDEEWLNRWALVGGIICHDCGSHLVIDSAKDAYTTIERI